MEIAGKNEEDSEYKEHIIFESCTKMRRENVESIASHLVWPHGAACIQRSFGMILSQQTRAADWSSFVLVRTRFCPDIYDGREKKSGLETKRKPRNPQIPGPVRRPIGAAAATPLCSAEMQRQAAGTVHGNLEREKIAEL